MSHGKTWDTSFTDEFIPDIFQKLFNGIEPFITDKRKRDILRYNEFSLVFDFGVFEAAPEEFVRVVLLLLFNHF